LYKLFTFDQVACLTFTNLVQRTQRFGMFFVIKWWNIFTRLAQPDRHLAAVTSRPLLLHAVGRLVTTGRRKIVRLTCTHAMADKVQMVLSRIGAFFNRLKAIAEQLSPEAIWAIILSVAFRLL